MYPDTLPDAPVFFYDERDCFHSRPSHLVDVSVHHSCDVGMHYHEFREINIVMGGIGCHYIGQTSIPLEGGEVFVIPPFVRHGYYCGRRLDVCHILLRRDFVQRYTPELSGVPGYSTLFEIEPYLRQVSDRRLFLTLDTARLDEVQRLINRARRCAEPQYDSYQSIAVLHLLSELCYDMERWRNDGSSVEQSDADILHVMEYIQAHYDEKLTVDDLTRLSHMSRPTFHRRFKAITRMTPMDYVLRCRVSAARTLLSDHSLSRTEIAHRCGFFDTSHMNKYLGRESSF